MTTQAKKPKRKIVSFSLQPEIFEELKRIGAKHNLSASRLLENLIVSAMLRDDLGKPPVAVF